MREGRREVREGGWKIHTIETTQMITEDARVY